MLVSYTHLDVYKRQHEGYRQRGSAAGGVPRHLEGRRLIWLPQAPHLRVQSSGAARQACALLFHPNLGHLRNPDRVDRLIVDLRGLLDRPT